MRLDLIEFFTWPEHEAQNTSCTVQAHHQCSVLFGGSIR